MTKELKLWTFAWPIFVSNLFGIVLGFIDVYVLSMVSDLAASAIGTACQVTSVCSLIFSVISGATTILVSQCLGRKDRTTASMYSVLCITLSLMIGTFMMLIVAGNYDRFLIVLGAKEQLLSLASAYLRIVTWGIVLEAYLSAINCIFYCHGETKITMCISVGMGILNLTFDIILVLGLLGFPRLGVAGAAYATVLVKFLGSVVGTYLFFSKVESWKIFLLLKQTKLKDIWSVFRLGIPSIFDSMNYNFTQLLITGLILHNLSNTDIIARTYLHSIASFFQIFCNAIASATQIMIGHSVGAKNYNQAEIDCTRGLQLGLCSTAVLSIGACFFAKPLFGIFTTQSTVLQLALGLMISNVFVELGRSMNVVYIWCLRGAGDVSVPVLIAVCCMWIIAVGGSWFVIRVLHGGIVLVWIVAGLDECVRAIIMRARWKSGKWKK